jgi:hypothetical protein
VPLSDDPPHTPTQVSVVLNGETHIIDRQHAADLIHRVFPLAPLPMRIEPMQIDPEFVAQFGTDWLVDLDAGSTQAAAAEVWFEARISTPHGFVTIEVPQP